MTINRSTLLILSMTAITTVTTAFAPSTAVSARGTQQQLYWMALPLHDAEAGKAASWAGARFGDEFLSSGHYSASETHGHTSSNAMDLPPSQHGGGTRAHHYTPSTTHPKSKSYQTSTWDGSAHTESGNDALEWSGARRGDYGVIGKKATPTAAQWHE